MLNRGPRPASLHRLFPRRLFCAAAALLMAGCASRAPSVATGFDLGASATAGVAIGRLNAGGAVRPGDEIRGEPSLRQELIHVETGRSYMLPFAGTGLQQDFDVVLPAGRYRLDDGRADSGTRGRGLSVFRWWEPGVEFDVQAGAVACVGELRVSTRQHLIGAILTGGRGAVVSWSVQDECEGISSRFLGRHPQQAAPATALATGP